jgi:hypothetical protein
VHYRPVLYAYTNWFVFLERSVLSVRTLTMSAGTGSFDADVTVVGAGPAGTALVCSVVIQVSHCLSV